MSTAEAIRKFLFDTLSRAGESFVTDRIAFSTLRSIGWSLEAVPEPFVNVAAAGQGLRVLWDELRYVTPSPGQLTELASRLDALWAALAELSEMPSPPGLGTSAFVSEVARDLVDRWLIETAEATTPAVVPMLTLFGLVEVRVARAIAPRGAYTVKRIWWERLGPMLADPGVPFRTAYGWGSGDFDAEGVLAGVRNLLTALHYYVIVRAPDSGVEGAETAEARTHTAVELVLAHEQVATQDVVTGLRMRPWHRPPRQPGLALEPILDLSRGLSLPLADGVHLEIESTADFSTGIAIVVEPGAGLSLRRVGVGDVAGGCTARVVVDSLDSARRVVLSLPVVTLSARSASARAWFGNSESADFGIEASALDALLAVDTTDLGGVLGRLIGARRWETSGAFGAGWSFERGLFFSGGGLEGTVPIRVTLGPVAFDGVQLRVGAAPQPSLVVALDGRVAFGFVTVAWRGLGGRIAIQPPTDSHPTVGVVATWEVPSSIELGVDASVAQGSGAFQSEGARYTGTLTIATLGMTLSAFGLVESQGASYSLVAAVASSFRTVPLGLGFTLQGVGGLIGIHRRVDTDALRAALRTPAGMGDLFFPADPVAQAARITTDLAAYFPAAEGRYVFGPAVKFGWGTPTMVRGALAVLLELPAPARVVVLGTVSAQLPTVEHAIVDLNVDVVGEVDFAQKRVAIDASLRNSTIAGFPITGDMAFRMAWGSPPSFALSIGGFHSQFRTPPGFPELRRIQIPLGSGDDPRLDVQGFLALTSNTAQMGASVDLYASAGPLNITGVLGFETLLTFSPFELQVDVWFGVALRRGTSTLAAIHFDGHLSGPTPWRVDGKACLSLWFIDLCVPIHVRFGGGQAATLPSRSIWPALRDAVATPAAWASTIPAGLAAAVTAAPAGAVRIEPCATLTMTQKVVPLDRQITAFAQGRPEGVDRFEITAVTLGTTAVPAPQRAPVTEWFAPAQFEKMSEADKLSRPGFEQMVGGTAIGATAIRAGAPLVRALDYDTVVVVNGQRQDAPRYRPSIELQLVATQASATARPPRGATGPAAFAPPAGTPPRMQLVEETFVIASVDALAARWDLAAAGTRGQAELALRAHLAAHPGDAGRLQVVPSFEVAA